MSGFNLIPRLCAEQHDKRAYMDGDESHGGSVMYSQSGPGSGWRKVSCSAREIT